MVVIFAVKAAVFVFIFKLHIQVCPFCKNGCVHFHKRRLANSEILQTGEHHKSVDV